MILFAAGNAGGQGPKSVTTEATGKNSLAVGSSETTYGGPNITYVAFYSSKGPTYDNRSVENTFISIQSSAHCLIVLSFPATSRTLWRPGTHWCLPCPTAVVAPAVEPLP